MEFIRGLHNLKAGHRGCVVTIGNFDGVHRGHQAMIERLREHGKRLGLPSTVLTFEPSPREFMDGERAPARLTRLREKFALLQKAGVDRCVVLHFNARLRKLRGSEFIELLDRSLGARAVVVGHDFRFAYRGEADVEVLRAAGPKHGFEVDVVAPVKADGERVSSSAIREALAVGDLKHAAQLLGRPYSMIGRVIEGEHLGAKLGYPTANMRLHRAVSPVNGVFAVWVHGVGAEPLPGVASLGTRPTVGGTEPLLETHVFDFDGELYGRRLEVEFVARLREERKFPSLDALVKQMHEDTRHAWRALEET